MSTRIAAYVRDTHYLGGVKHPRGEMLPGWACCCTGERVLRIMRSAAPLTWNRDEVTCKGCLRVMAKASPNPTGPERRPQGMSKPFDMIAGAQIHVEPARYDTAAIVTLHKLGSADRLYLSTDEARRLGQALVAASAKASES